MLSHKAILHVVCLIVVYLYCVRATPDYSNEDDCVLLPGLKLGTNSKGHNETIMFVCGNISTVCEFLKQLGGNTSKCDSHSKNDKTSPSETTYTCFCVYTCCHYLCATNHTGGYTFYILSGLSFIAIGTLSIYAALALIALLGFTPAGIVAGSWGASLMSFMAPTSAGGIVAILQSIGVLGFGIASKILLFITGGTVGTAGIHITGYVLRFCYETLFYWEPCECECMLTYNVTNNVSVKG